MLSSSVTHSEAPHVVGVVTEETKQTFNPAQAEQPVSSSTANLLVSGGTVSNAVDGNKIEFVLQHGGKQPVQVPVNMSSLVGLAVELKPFQKVVMNGKHNSCMVECSWPTVNGYGFDVYLSIANQPFSFRSSCTMNADMKVQIPCEARWKEDQVAIQIVPRAVQVIAV